MRRALTTVLALAAVGSLSACGDKANLPDNVLYAIRNGGYSGAIMPQNIVVGKDADNVAAFLSKYSGKKAKKVRSGGDSKPEDTAP